LLVPLDWTFLKNESLIQVLFYYANEGSCPIVEESDHRALALNCISYLSCLKKGIFSSLSERRSFLSSIIDGICYSYESGVLHAYSDPNLFPQISDVLNLSLFSLTGRIRGSFHPSDLVSLSNCFKFLTLARSFVLFSLTSANSDNPHVSTLNALDLWSGFVRSCLLFEANLSEPSDRDVEFVNMIRSSTLDILNQYVDSKQKFEGEENLESSIRIMSQYPSHEASAEVQSMLGMIGASYETFLSHLCGVIDEIKASFLEFLSTPFSSEDNEELTLELRSCWCLYMAAGLCDFVLEESFSSARVCQSPGFTLLISKIFDLVNTFTTISSTAESSIAQLRQQQKPFECIQLSWIHFLSSYHQLCTFDRNDSELSSVIDVLLTRISENVLKMNALEFIARELFRVFSTWMHSSVVCEAALELFRSLALGVAVIFSDTSYPKLLSNGKLLLQSDYVREILFSSDANRFPFVNRFVFRKYRTVFFEITGKLVCMHSEDEVEDRWLAFMDPLTPVAEQMLAVSESYVQKDNISEQHLLSVSSFLCDIRGLLSACSKKSVMNLFFSWFFPVYMRGILNLSDVLLSNVESGMILANTCFDLVEASRVYVPIRGDSEPLFIFDSVAVVISKLLRKIQLTLESHAPNSEEYEAGLIGLQTCLKTLERTLVNHICHLGIMKLYSDPNLEAFRLAMCASVRIPSDLLFVSLLFFIFSDSSANRQACSDSFLIL